jgi:hypothetical protein
MNYYKLSIIIIIIIITMLTIDIPTIDKYRPSRVSAYKMMKIRQFTTLFY